MFPAACSQIRRVVSSAVRFRNDVVDCGVSTDKMLAAYVARPVVAVEDQNPQFPPGTVVPSGITTGAALFPPFALLRLPQLQMSRATMLVA